MTPRVVIGVDGGGSQLRVALVSETGAVLGVSVSGPGNYHDVGAEAVRANLEEALAHAFAEAGVQRRPAGAAFLGMASVVSDDDQAAILWVARNVRLASDEAIGVDHDLRIAHAGGFAGRPGIVLIVGTGSSCYGRTEGGRTWRAGGWGSRLDDLGSSSYLGLQAMIAAVRAHDGRGEQTVLRERVLETLQLSDINQIMFRVDAERFSRRDTAKLASLVTHAAHEGDTVALRIIERGSDELALMIETVASQLGLGDTPEEPVDITMTGGLLDAGPIITGPLCRAIGRRIPHGRIVDERMPPVFGAALLALERLHGDISEDVRRTLMQGAHEWVTRADE